MTGLVLTGITIGNRIHHHQMLRDIRIKFEHSQESFLWNFHITNLLHALLTLLLLKKKLMQDKYGITIREV